MNACVYFGVEKMAPEWVLNQCKLTTGITRLAYGGGQNNCTTQKLTFGWGYYLLPSTSGREGSLKLPPAVH